MWQAAGVSDAGTSRERNEDRFLIDEALRLCVLADGMGGLGQGEVAAGLACEVIGREVRQGRALPQAVAKAHCALLRDGQRLSPGKGLGSTVVALSLLSRPGVLVWAGDSRCYRLRAGQLQCLTTDHTFAQGLLDAGAISEEEARAHPQRHVVTRALGQKLGKLSCRSVYPRTGDRYLLCSDGISGVLEDSSLQAVLETQTERESCAQSLVDTAVGAGSRDNLTAIVLDIGGQP